MDESPIVPEVSTTRLEEISNAFKDPYPAPVVADRLQGLRHGPELVALVAAHKPDFGFEVFGRFEGFIDRGKAKVGNLI